MTYTISIADELLEWLKGESKRSGVPVSGIIRAALMKHREERENPGTTGGEPRMPEVAVAGGHGSLGELTEEEDAVPFDPEYSQERRRGSGARKKEEGGLPSTSEMMKKFKAKPPK